MREKTAPRAFLIQSTAAAIIAVHISLLAWSATRHSPTVDEVAHLPAGISHWRTGAFHLYSVNPPLVRMVAALPVLMTNPRTEWLRAGDGDVGRPEFRVGAEFIKANGARSFWLFTLARCACIPFSVLGAVICYRWATDLFGPLSGLLALTLWCFCPNVLAHAELITPDVGAAAFSVAAMYFFWRWGRGPTWPKALAAGWLLGAAALTKTTVAALFPLMIALAYLPDRRADAIRWPSRLLKTSQLLAILMTGALILNAGYGFEGTFKRLGEYRFYSATFGGAPFPAIEAGNRFENSWFGLIPVPVPKHYLGGIDLQLRDFQNNKLSYLRGEQRHGGWWYYYLYGLAVKSPLSTLLLGALAVGAFCWTAKCRRGLTEEAALGATPLAVLILVSAETGMNHHLRYVLPALPFVFIWISRLGRLIRERRRGFRLAVAGLIASSIASTLSVYPHCLSYFNELAGGPRNGHEHLVDSNVDWGQDLFYLRDWLAENRVAEPVELAYFGFVDPSVVGINYQAPASMTQSWDQSATDDELSRPFPHAGWYAVSVNLIHGYTLGAARYEPRYTCFRRTRPVGRAGYSMYIYHLTEAEAERLRVERRAL